MLTCKETAIIVLSSSDTKHSLRDRFSMKAHLVMCKSCQRFSNQITLLNQTLQHRINNIENSSDKVILTEETRQRILNTIRN